jgi:uncharacterized membrane protein YdjX (TVP38/TMEM64 family)
MLLAAALVLAFLSYSATTRALLNSTNAWAKNVIEANPFTGAVVFFLFSALSAMLAFASSAVLIPAANLVWGKLVTFFLLWGGWVAGAIAGFGIGKLARPLLIRLGYKERLEKYREYVSRRMKFWMVLLFCFAVPSEIPGYVLGGVHYPFWRFLLAMAIAESIYALGLVFAGESLATARTGSFIIIVAVVILIAAVAGLLFRKLRERRSMRKHVD